MEHYIIHALLAGAGIALLSAPLGCFIAWRRMAYFGDAVAHAALLGVVLALSLHIDLAIGVAFVAVALALCVHSLRSHTLSADTSLGIVAHGALALGMVLLSLSDAVVDINGLLFGDILSVRTHELWMIYALAISVLCWLRYRLTALMRLIVHEDIAAIEGIHTRRLSLELLVVIALTVAASIKLVGILLITSLLIVPAAAARAFSRTPTHMMWVSSLIGVLAVVVGLSASIAFDTPTGPSVVLAAVMLLAISRLSR